MWPEQRKVNMATFNAEDSADLDQSALIGSVERGSTLTDKVYRKLRQALLRGVWEPGQKITARSLSRDMNVSLTPVREAIMKLANEGALEISETRTFMVPALDRARYLEVTSIRLALEPVAADAAFPFITPKVIKRLDELNEELRELIEAERFNEALQVDSEFHHMIYDLSGQELLRNIIDSLWLRVGPTRTLLSHTFRKRLVGYSNHKVIIQALRDKDGQAFRAALHRDISDGSESLIKALKS